MNHFHPGFCQFLPLLEATKDLGSEKLEQSRNQFYLSLRGVNKHQKKVLRDPTATNMFFLLFYPLGPLFFMFFHLNDELQTPKSPKLIIL